MQAIQITQNIPLIGCIAFGIIDRGTNLVQIRPNSACNLNCIFCSTNANNPDIHPVEYNVDCSYLLNAARKVVEYKNCPVEANIDSVGEPLLYKDIIRLIKGMNGISKVYRISMQTNGALLTKEKIRQLLNAGLSHINLSVNSLEQAKAEKLSGCCYNLAHILDMVNAIKEAGIGLRLCPVWIPKINDKDITGIIRFAKENVLQTGIQKYEIYKYGKKPAKAITWWKFYEQLRIWEKEFDAKLVLSANDLGIHKAQRLPTAMEINQTVYAEIACLGWFKSQMIAVANKRCISINNCKGNKGDRIKLKILNNKDNIYVGEQVTNRYT
ncbi:radical SAM protein [archaeon]|nr:radical SAM protein [archaeon]